MESVPQRRFFSIIDGIIAGERDGPMKAIPKAVGRVIGGENLIAVDVIATMLMGFDPNKLKYLTHLLKPHRYNLSINIEDIVVESNVQKYKDIFTLPRKETLCFDAPQTWEGYMELE
ncbi:TPA: hypothetical protein EYP70_06885 [Candidatus Bathyarchaeota archaeon]|nr:hypothetical protein [Candidatus Bathyarchaeota archaeon]